MAIIIPSDWEHLDNLHELEKETLYWLETSLPENVHVFAGLRWAATLGSGAAHFGEVDMAIVAPSGQLLLIEQKNGGLSVERGELIKRYGSQAKSVVSQIRRSVDAIKTQWHDQGHNAPLDMDYLVYLPDYRVHDVSAVAIQQDRLIDRENRGYLTDRIMALVDGKPAPTREQQVLAFLHNALGVVESVDIGSLRIKQRYRQEGDNLYRMVSALSFSPWRLRITGPAGCGKTLLGHAFFRDARQRKQKALYLCYNRPLADALGKSMSATDKVMTIDHLTTIYPLDDDFDPASGTDGFERRRKQILAAPVADGWQQDLLVVDEGQDFSSSQLALVEHLLVDEGRILWLDDPTQTLYEREQPAVFSATVTLSLRDNYRNARSIVKNLNALLKPAQPDNAVAAIEGDEVCFLPAAGQDIERMIAEQVEALLEAGYLLDDIVVLSYHGMATSALLKQPRIGRWRTSHFTGEYDDTGNQCYTAGELRLESLHRFKGLQAEAVILVEVDFDTLDEKARQRLYVGMTRARQKLVLLLSPDAENAIRQQLCP